MENNAPASLASAALPRLTLEAIYADKIFETTLPRQPHWMLDGKRFSYLDTLLDTEITTVWIYDIETGTRRPIIAPETLCLPDAEPEQAVPAETANDSAAAPKLIAIQGYQWSPDETRLLLAHLPQRRASHGDKTLYVYTLATGDLQKVADSEHEHRNVKWSPDGNFLGYVRNDDIYLLELATGIETRLTSTPSSTLYNGRFGWVYEEELELADGWAFSPDGRYLAYYQIDETAVPQIDLPDYADLHMKPVQMRYPKAGDPNPLVKIGIIALADVTPIREGINHDGINREAIWIKTEAPPQISQNNADFQTPIPSSLWLDLGADTDIYIARMQWTPDGNLLLQRIPRLQNKIELLLADPATGRTRVILTEEDAAWVDSRKDLTFVASSIAGTELLLWPSDRSGYNHLYLYDMAGQLIRQLTQGDWDVEAVVGVDPEHGRVTFTAATPSPLERHLYTVPLAGGEPVRITQAPGTHSALLSPDGRHILHTHSARAVAPQMNLCLADGSPIATVYGNTQPKLKDIPLSDWEFTTFQTDDGVTLHAALLRPRNFDPQRKYPVLMHTYGGPASQVVRNAYGNGGGLEQFFAANDVIYALVDGRGSGGRGRDFKKVTYLKLGDYEVQDQIAGAKWLGSLPYVDARRIGIWGWSYGGYMASLCILRGAHVFAAAAAVAPVTHWGLYDSIYTERYMRRPQDNPDGYAATAPLTDVEKLRGKFLLAHGLADDNVHFQNAAQLAAALQKANKPFRAMFYPGKHHGLEGVALHWATLITDFFLEALSLETF